MPKLIAIECSTDACSAALSNEGVLIERFVIQPRQHNQILLQMVADVLKEGGLMLDEIDAFAFGVGPGSFTGLRLALGVVQGLAYSVQKPVISVSSLKAMAYSFAIDDSMRDSAAVLVAEDARMGDCYFAAYEVINKQIKILEADALIPVALLEQKIADYPKAHCIGGIWLKPVNIHPKASTIAFLANLDLAAGLVQNPLSAKPVYLRDTISWQKWQPKKGAAGKSI